MSTARHDDHPARSRRPQPGARALVVAPDPARAHALALRMRYQGYRPSVVRDASGAVAEARLGACGDWCLGARVEAAFDSGNALAAHLLGEETPALARDVRS